MVMVSLPERCILRSFYIAAGEIDPAGAAKLRGYDAMPWSHVELATIAKDE